MKKYKLYIDTRNNRKIFVGLVINGQIKISSKVLKTWTSQIILKEIVRALNKESIAFSRIDEIKVEAGPGSYTGLRVGVSVANALGWLLQIPVNGKKDGIIIPAYT